MANIPIPYTFIAGTIIDPDQMNANFQAISTGAASEVGGDLNAPILTNPTLTGTITLAPGAKFTGDLLFTPDATYDIGKLGATRPRDGFFSRNVLISGLLQVASAGLHYITGNADTAHVLNISNTSGGSSANSNILMDNDVRQSNLTLRSTNYNAPDGYTNDGVTLRSNGTGGLALAAQHVSGSIRFYTGGVIERMRINANGTVGLATGAALVLSDLSGVGAAYLRQPSQDILQAVGGAGAYNFETGYFYPVTDNARSLGFSLNRWTAVYALNGAIQTSDRARKTRMVASRLGLDFILRLTPSEFSYTDEGETRRHGLIAQDVIAAAQGQSLAGIVTGEDGDYGLNYAGLTTPLVSAIHAHETRLARLETLMTERT